MAVRVDLDNKTITAAIRDLIETPEGARGLGLPLELRAELGRRVHTRYSSERAGAGYTPELGIRFSHQVDGFTAELSGRLDGLLDDGKVLIAEEIKSVALTPNELRGVEPEDVPDHCLQVRLYALGLRQTHPHKPVQPRVVLCSLHGSARRVLEVAFDEGSTRAQLDTLLRRAIALQKERQARAAKRLQCAGEIRFPYRQLRPHQQRLIELLAQGLKTGRPVLAMAPTGLGKTVAAVFAGLSYALARDARLFYATAKRTQQELVWRTFEDLCAGCGWAPNGQGGQGGQGRTVSAITLRAKERMCPPGHLLCQPELCPLLKDFDERLSSSGVEEELFSGQAHIAPDAVYARGEALQLCPFELSMRLARRAELVIGDYNYVYDRPPAGSGDCEEPRTVVVIDEAHNLFDRAREYASPFLSCETLDEARKSLRAAMPRSRKNSQQLLLDLPELEAGPKILRSLSRFIGRLKAYLEQRLEAASECGLEFMEGCAAVEPDAESWTGFAEDASRLFVDYVLHNRMQRLVQPQDPVLQVLRTVLRIRELLAEQAEEYLPLLATRAAPAGAGMGLLCLNPARHLARHHQRAAGTVAMSATLTPLAYYQDVLGFGELNPLTESVPSPFPSENREIAIVPAVDTSYRARARYYTKISQIIAEVVGVRPGCYAAYFPSFEFLAAVRMQLTLPAAQVLVQKPDMAEDERRQLLEQMRSGTGARLLLAVLGGVFAEGIDLPGEALVGAIIVGPGLPKVGFEREQMRRYFDAQGRDGFAYAMLYPGMQRVIQAAGRVIRTMEDRGVIVLLCRRFTDQTYAACLPADWKALGLRHLIAPDPTLALRAFWQRHR